MEVTVAGATAHAGTGSRDFDVTLPTVVFIHGAGMDGTVWQFQARHFAHHGYAVLAVDLPGHGRSGGAPPEAITGYTTWLLALFRALGLDEVRLVGHSMGALVALHTAAEAPDRVSRLALLGVAARMPVHPELMDAAKRDDRLAIDLVASWSHASAAGTEGRAIAEPWTMEMTVRLLERARPGVLYAGLVACDHYAAAERDATSVRCPTLLLVGEDDRMTRPTGATPLARAIVDVRTVVLSDTGHLSMVERPDAVIEELAAFFGDRR